MKPHSILILACLVGCESPPPLEDGVTPPMRTTDPEYVVERWADGFRIVIEYNVLQWHR
jgi:hypothetical protein